MTGAGFGGCAVALVQSDCVDDFINDVNDKISSISAHAERKVLNILEGDCYTAVGVFSKVNEDNFEISGELFSVDGKKRYFKKIKDKVSNYLNASIELGNYLKSEAMNNYKK